MASSGSRGDGLGTSLGSATTGDAGADAETVASGCVDADGDGYGVDCDLGPDCDDADAARFTELSGFVDADDDGYGDLPATLCAADEGSVPRRMSARSGGCHGCQLRPQGRRLRRHHRRRLRSQRHAMRERRVPPSGPDELRERQRRGQLSGRGGWRFGHQL